MFSGTVYKPRRVKEEESERYFVMGSDPYAVDRVLEYQQQDVARQLRLQNQVPGEMIEKECMVVKKRGAGFGHVVLAGAVGGFIVFYCLVHL
jgi:hypothetical protein